LTDEMFRIKPGKPGKRWLKSSQNENTVF
jgi:hypothetical protein